MLHTVRTCSARIVAHTGVALAVVWAAPAVAQDMNPFDSIENRSRPEYATPPIRIGAFEVTPKIEVQAEYIDNVYASDALQADDVVLAVRPSVVIADRRPDRELRLNLSTGYETYLDNSASDRFQAQAHGSARFGLGRRTRPFLGFDLRLNDTQSETLTEVGNVAQPLNLFSLVTNAGVEQDLGPITATVEGRFADTSYSGDIVVNGTRLDGSFRDYRLYNGRARVAYSVNPAQRIYLEGGYARYDYSQINAPPNFPAIFLRDRSGDSISVRVGFQRQLTELLQLDVSAGYAQQRYDNPALRNISAFAYEGDLYFSPTALTRFRLRASRSIDDGVNPLFSSFLRTEFSLSVEHELRRNLVIGAQGRYSTFDSGSVDNLGDEYQFSGSARYFVSPRWSLHLRGEYFNRTGAFSGDQKRVLLGASYNF